MLELDVNTFETEVLQSSGKRLVDFYGAGCAPCEELMPHIHALEALYGNELKFCAFNTNQSRRLALSQQIMGLPAIVIYEDGVQVERCMKGDATPENVEALIKRHL